ncbi:unnamed protein product (macronuclear) [Paramecium tetraurelia]|uniref:Transmembrane protein n=1 Tax=Paramecium tetraurelia TaxID=5888 RepID=A0CYM5_PARTE|nr:uncharacterized protein GSPATT00011493001 [Paramecium tetraurelia]CAK75892.1 unnamed protein product [Paramecium tetraurelia]|eukprot:XP_001443289.1 hypothetical protein (macronuclear) [Paramecium tetraurelia strain d4-2]
MILLLLTQIQLSFGVSTSRVRSQQSHTLQAMLPDISLQTIHNKQNIFALNISEAYDIDLIDEDGKIIETPYVSLDNLDLDHFIVENQCVAFPKYPQLTELMDYHIWNSSNDTFYSEIITATDYSNMYVVTQDLVLLQFKLSTKYWVVSQQLKQIDLKQYINLEDQSIRTNAYFSCPKGHLNCLVISQYGAFWIPKFVDFDDPKTEILPEQDKNFIIRKEIIKIFTFESIVAIAAGEDGVDIYRCGYKISSNFEKKIYYLTTIGNVQMEMNSNQQIYIIGVKINDTLLYVLDEDLGLFIFDIQNISKSVLKMRIPIPRTIAFDFYGNTLMVVAETVNHIQYILEIFLDFNANTYYVNRVYVDDFTFVDIQMTDEYAFFIAEDTHMIIKHSIFNGFVKNNKELVRTFFEDQLIKFQHFTQVVEQSQRYSKTIYYVGLSKKSIHAWKFRNYNSFIACSFDSRVEKQYTLKSNASYCYQDQEKSPYIQCQMIQKISVTSDGTLLESDSLTLIITVSCISSAIFILLIVLLCTKWRKFVKSIKEKTDKLRNKQDYNRIEQEKNP